MPRTTNIRYDAQRAHRGGRIHPHQRDTDDNAAVLGDNLESPRDLAAKYNETMKGTMTDGCRWNYRQRILHIIEFWRQEDPEYFAVGVRQVPEEEGKDETKYFFDCLVVQTGSGKEAGNVFAYDGRFYGVETGYSSFS